MANSRNVIAASSAVNRSKQFSTTADTFGELKQDSNLSSLVSDWSAVDVVCSVGNVTLKRDDAVLPVGDFRLYIIPTKNKLGLSQGDAQVLAQEISSAIINAANRASKDEVDRLRDILVDDIEEFFGVSSDDNCSECDDALETAREMSED